MGKNTFELSRKNCVQHTLLINNILVGKSYIYMYVQVHIGGIQV